MKPLHWVLPLALMLSGCSKDDQVVHLRGELTTADHLWFLAPCDSSDVYWVRVMASNPHFRLFQRIEEIKKETGKAIVMAEFEGSLRGPDEGMASGRKTNGVLYVSKIVAVDDGSCETVGRAHKS